MELQNKEMKITAIQLKLPTDYGDISLKVPCDIKMELVVADGGAIHYSIDALYQLVIQSKSVARNGGVITNSNGWLCSTPAGAKFDIPEHTVRLTVGLKGWAHAPQDYSLNAVVTFANAMDTSPTYTTHLLIQMGYSNAVVDGVTLEYTEPTKE